MRISGRISSSRKRYQEIAQARKKVIFLTKEELKKVRDNHLEVTTVKTADSISIEVNDMMPYIDVVDSIKVSEMARMNFMD